MSALFAHLVMQNTNLAMMLMGKAAQPGGDKVVQDLDGARLFIDQLEMLEVKTKGNLTKEEADLLKRSLMSLRLAFVEVVEAAPALASAGPGETAATPAQPVQGQSEPTPAAGAEEHRTKFTKKY